MKLTARVIDAMLAAGCTAEQIGAAVKAALTIDDESQAERREKDRIRKREQRERENANKNNDSVHDVTRTRADIADPSPEGFLSPEPPILPNPQPVPPSPPKGGSSPVDRAIEIFSEEAQRANLPVPRKVTADRRRKIEARLREHGESVWAEACRKMSDSPFCRGENERGWRADLDFLCQPKSFNGLIEGKYDNRSSPQRRSTSPPRNAGELSYQQLMDQIDEYPSQHDRRLEPRNGNGEAENLGSFKKFAVSGDFLRRM